MAAETRPGDLPEFVTTVLAAARDSRHALAALLMLIGAYSKYAADNPAADDAQCASNALLIAAVMALEGAVLSLPPLLASASAAQLTTYNEARSALSRAHLAETRGARFQHFEAGEKLKKVIETILERGSALFALYQLPPGAPPTLDPHTATSAATPTFQLHQDETYRQTYTNLSEAVDLYVTKLGVVTQLFLHQIKGWLSSMSDSTVLEASRRRIRETAQLVAARHNEDSPFRLMLGQIAAWANKHPQRDLDLAEAYVVDDSIFGGFRNATAGWLVNELRLYATYVVVRDHQETYPTLHAGEAVYHLWASRTGHTSTDVNFRSSRTISPVLEKQTTTPFDHRRWVCQQLLLCFRKRACIS